MTRPADLGAPLRGDIRADVAIIGAGYTGLSTALALQRAGVDVVILEREFAGFGASGRNAGHLTSTIGKDLPTLLMLFGTARAARLVRFAEDAVRCVEEMIRPAIRHRLRLSPVGEHHGRRPPQAGGADAQGRQGRRAARCPRALPRSRRHARSRSGPGCPAASVDGCDA
jgi:glycine/D-amino acid oxidase-like deaminating enzyme